MKTVDMAISRDVEFLSAMLGRPVGEREAIEVTIGGLREAVKGYEEAYNADKSRTPRLGAEARDELVAGSEAIADLRAKLAALNAWDADAWRRESAERIAKRQAESEAQAQAFKARQANRKSGIDALQDKWKGLG